MSNETQVAVDGAGERDDCPQCGGDTTWMYGLGGGVDADGNPTSYRICLDDCGWQEPKPKATVCFPHGLVEEPS